LIIPRKSCDNVRMNNQALHKAISILGSQTRLAKRLGTYPQLVQSWTKTKVPARWARSIEAATGGKVRAIDLRPDIFGEPDHVQTDDDAA
jgi:DNA-binding transcriptional regulator YdaS (Cro superfamily)